VTRWVVTTNGKQNDNGGCTTCKFYSADLDIVMGCYSIDGSQRSHRAEQLGCNKWEAKEFCFDYSFMNRLPEIYAVYAKQLGVAADLLNREQRQAAVMQDAIERTLETE